MDTALLQQIAYAVGIGVLVGLERSMKTPPAEEGPPEPGSPENSSHKGLPEKQPSATDDADGSAKTTGATAAGMTGLATGAGSTNDPVDQGDSKGTTEPEGTTGSVEMEKNAADWGRGGVEEDAIVPVDVALPVKLTVKKGQPDGSGGTRSLDEEIVGVRTFTVLSLVGLAGALLAERYGLVAPVMLAAVSLLVLAMYWRVSHLGEGITTELAAIGTCGLGMLCRFNPHTAGVLAILLTAILASKRFTRKTVAKMKRMELAATLKFLAVILIVLPLLPNRPLDPYGAFNPYKVGLLVVLISGISFVGYFLTRILGAQRGLGITGILGGLTSSTAVTAAMSAEAKQNRSLHSICAFSTLAANATMFVRVLVVVAVLDRLLVMRLAWSVGAMALVAAISAVVLWLIATRSARAEREGRQQLRLKNPFSLGPALKFAAFFAGIIFLAKLATMYFGDSGLYAASALSGLADVDAITLTIAEQARDGSLVREIGAIGITIAVVSNSLVKSGIAIYSGGWRFGRIVLLCLGLATIVGLGVAFLLPVLS
ncbi:MAG: MgtC/SapB family protein [Bradymonadales bacterium]|nr:MgtC/SapB family protein [Bradymonadales bacterium]